jgi:hypothetical protein
MGSSKSNHQVRKIFGLRASAIFETLFFLIILTALNYLFGDGERFIHYSLHPFWIIVLLMTVQYGTAEGIFAALLSTLFLYAGNIPPQKINEPYFDYQFQLAYLPGLWLLTAFILGELRMRQEWENQRLKEDFTQAKLEAEKITSEYQVLKETNDHLEIQLTSQEETAAASYRAFKAIAALEPAQIIFGLSSIIDKALHPRKFSVFAKGPDGLEAVTSEGWDVGERFSRRFSPASALYKAIADDKKLISAVNKDEQKILEHEGILAAPLADPDSGEVFGMIKIEEIDFRTLNLSRIETFRTVCELIGRAYSNAKKHRSAKQQSIYAIPGILYSFPLYQIASSYFQKIAEGASFPWMILKIQLRKGKQIEPAWLKSLLMNLPQTAVAFEGSKKSKELLLLCPLTRDDQKERLEEQVARSLYTAGMMPDEFEIQQEMPFSKVNLEKE